MWYRSRLVHEAQHAVEMSGKRNGYFVRRVQAYGGIGVITLSSGDVELCSKFRPLKVSQS